MTGHPAEAAENRSQPATSLPPRLEAGRLDDRLAEIRRQQDAGDITVREAADRRVTALEDHLAALAALREAGSGLPVTEGCEPFGGSAP